jgi:hypothetical protein
MMPRAVKDGGVLRTVGDAHAYILALPKTRERCAHWQHAWRLLRKLNAGAFEHMSSARRGDDMPLRSGASDRHSRNYGSEQLVSMATWPEVTTASAGGGCERLLRPIMPKIDLRYRTRDHVRRSSRHVAAENPPAVKREAER